MSTIKLYYKDPYLKSAVSPIVSEKEDGRGLWYTFAETVFYPEGGGQSADSGWINHERVLDVQSDGREVWHLLPVQIVSPAKMQLEWTNRYENMRQHTGQHILSACFKTRHDLDTVAVHLGQEITMIELKTAEIDVSVLTDTEQAANKIIREGHPVKPVEIKREELESTRLRRSVKTEQDDVRLVNIGEIDSVGCGGLHVASTSEVGLIKIVGTEKIRNHCRVHIKIGSSAYVYFDELHQVARDLSKNLTTSVGELPDRIKGLLSENKEQRRKISRVQDLWMEAYVQTLTNGAYEGCFFLKNLTAANLKTLSEHWLKINKRSCLFVSQDQNRYFFFIRMPADNPYNLQEFLDQSRENFSLRGGGGKAFASGQIDQKIMQPDLCDALFKSFIAFQKTGEY